MITLDKTRSVDEPVEQTEQASDEIQLTIPRELGKRIGERASGCPICRQAVYMELIQAMNDPEVFLHALLRTDYLDEEEQRIIANGLVQSSPSHETIWKAFLETCHEVDRDFRHAYPVAAEIITEYALQTLPLDELFILTTTDSRPFSWQESSPMAIKCAKAIKEKYGESEEYKSLCESLREQNLQIPEHISILIS